MRTGRPKVKEKRDRFIGVKLNIGEYEHLLLLASENKLKPSTYLRNLLLNQIKIDK